MPEKIKSSIAVFIILLLVSLSFAGAGFYLLQKEKMKNLSLQEEIDSLKIKQNAAETKLQEYKKTITQLELKLNEAQANIDKLTSTLEEEKKAGQEVLAEVQQLKSELGKQKDLRSELESKLQQAQKDAEKTQTQLKEIESEKTQLEARLKDLEAQSQQGQVLEQGQSKGVELGTIVVGQEGSLATPSSLEGKVLVVNKDYNFVVINLGTKDGVNTQDVFALYHNNKYIGDIKVEKIHESMSAADFMAESIKGEVSEGDRVVQKTK